MSFLDQTMRVGTRCFVGLMAVGLGFLGHPVAYACASCACGDPTLTVMGTSQPFQGRLRMGVESQLRWMTSGAAGVDEVRISEQRWALESAWAPHSRLFLSARLPLVRREVALPDLSEVTLFHLGDVELSGRWFIFRDRNFRPRHLISLGAGVELATAPELRGPEGQSLGFEAQLGSGSFDPSVSLGYTFSSGNMSIYTAARWLVPTEGRFDAQSGMAVLASGIFQFQVQKSLALRGGIDFRWEDAFVEGGEEDPHSGGTVLFITPDAVWSPWTDIVLRAAVSVPVVRDFRGVQSEGPTVRLGVIFDV